MAFKILALMALLSAVGCGGGGGSGSPDTPVPDATDDDASGPSTDDGGDGDTSDPVSDVELSGRWVSTDNSNIMVISSSGRVSRVVKTAQVTSEICVGDVTTEGQQFEGELRCIAYLADPDAALETVPTYAAYQVSGTASEQGSIEFSAFAVSGSASSENLSEPNYDFDLDASGSYFGEIIPGLYVNELGNSNVNSQRLVAFIRVDSDGAIAAVTPQQLRPNNTAEWLGVEAFCRTSGQITDPVVGTDDNRGSQSSFDAQIDVSDCNEASVATLKSLTNGARLKGDHNQSASQAFGVSGASTQFGDYFIDLYTPGNAATNEGNNAGWDRYYRVCDDAETSRRTSYGITLEDQYTQSATYPQGFANLCNDFIAR
jgi:hypothetical protein|tara:strand:- start:19 stop:1137 length:1119 start_codon:yes stop_codon:yes gene_type:complete